MPVVESRRSMDDGLRPGIVGIAAVGRVAPAEPGERLLGLSPPPTGIIRTAVLPTLGADVGPLQQFDPFGG